MKRDFEVDGFDYQIPYEVYMRRPMFEVIDDAEKCSACMDDDDSTHVFVHAYYPTFKGFQWSTGLDAFDVPTVTEDEPWDRHRSLLEWLVAER